MQLILLCVFGFIVRFRNGKELMVMNGIVTGERVELNLTLRPKAIACSQW